MVDNLNNVIVRVPEYIIFYGLSNALAYLKQDLLDNSADETKSLLYLMLKNVGIQRFEFFTQAKKVFASDVDEPRTLDLSLMYNQNKNGSPSVYISLPAEQPAQNSLGIGQGDNDPVFIESDNSLKPTLSRRFQATYSLVITSDSDNEVILVYHVLRALIISLYSHFHLAGLTNISLAGADLRAYNKDIPHNHHVRSINITCQYETSTVDLWNIPIINQMMFSSTPYDDTTTTTTTTTTSTTTSTTTTTLP